MAWLVFDTALRLAERFGLDAPVLSWKQVRQEIHDEVCAKGYDPRATPSPSTTARRSSTPPPWP
jgi:GH15 family glucan-1,4-alpha-glucosidase